MSNTLEQIREDKKQLEQTFLNAIKEFLKKYPEVKVSGISTIEEEGFYPHPPTLIGVKLNVEIKW